jgi:hypothetical protein
MCFESLSEVITFDLSYETGEVYNVCEFVRWRSFGHALDCLEGINVVLECDDRDH